VGVSAARRFPGSGSGFSDAGDEPSPELGKNVAKVFAELGVQTSAAFHNGKDGSDLRADCFVAQVKPVSASFPIDVAR